MERIKKLDLHEEIVEAVKVNRVKILGICLGMQLFGESGTENGFHAGLNLLPLEVADFSFKNSKQIKIPHIGFNQVESMEDSVLFHSLPRKSDFYFVHSYRMLPKLKFGKSATTVYGEKFLSAYEHENVFATQFHPEKSQTNGLTLLKNFLKA
jgi:glutamine amidotransferase